MKGGGGEGRRGHRDATSSAFHFLFARLRNLAERKKSGFPRFFRPFSHPPIFHLFCFTISVITIHKGTGIGIAGQMIGRGRLPDFDVS